MDKKLYIVIPAYNEAPRLPQLLKKLSHLGYKHVVVVNDGSDDDTAAICRNHHIKVVSHPINLGVGAATKTGIDYALMSGADYIITLDGDHQHLPGDIAHLYESILDSGADLVIGSRFLCENDIPQSRRVYNKIANVVTLVLTGRLVTDSQSGMKAMTRRFARACDINFNGFEFCVEIIRNANRLNARIEEVPISVVYSKETMQKGQSFFNGVKMLGRLVRMNLFS